MKVKFLIVAAMTMVAGMAYADQCQVVTKKQAAGAMDLISASKRAAGGVVQFCQPCGDKKAVATRVNQIDFAKDEVAINGEPIDLAYTYVLIGPNTWVNLSKLVSCPSDGVSPFLIQKANGSFAASKKY